MCIVVISVLFAGFFAPVLENKWEWDISLGPGDYFLLDGSVLKSDCYNNQFEIQVKQISLLYPIPGSLTDLRCKENMFAGESRHNETHYTTISYYNSTSNILWLPNNSVSFQHIDSIIFITTLIGHLLSWLDLSSHVTLLIVFYTCMNIVKTRVKEQS